MSIQAITWVLEHSESTGTTRNVMIAIANHISPDGVGWAYRKRIIKDARCSMDSYRRAVTWLEEHGELEREIKQGAALKAFVGYRPNEFSIPALVAAAAEKEDGNLPPSTGPGGGSSPSTEDGNLPPAPDGKLPPSQEEPSKEPSKETEQRVPEEPTPFDRFWEIFALSAAKGSRRKTAKPAAAKAFAAAVKRGNDPEVILAGAARWSSWYADRAESNASEVQYEPLATTFLNQDRWNDETPAGRSHPGVSSNLDAVREAVDAYEVGGVAPGDLFGFEGGEPRG